MGGFYSILLGWVPAAPAVVVPDDVPDIFQSLSGSTPSSFRAHSAGTPDTFRSGDAATPDVFRPKV